MAQTKPADEPMPEDIVFQWWRGLADRSGDRAALRRAGTPAEVVFLPAYHDLRQRLSGTGWQSWRALASMAGVLAHVREDDARRRFPEQLAAPGRSGGGALLSGLRFRRLIQHTDRDELFLPLIRVIRLLGGTANVRDLAKSIQYWGERTRREWAFAYYEHAPADEA
jgi:CRISPR system Cascade subunit CasB